MSLVPCHLGYKSHLCFEDFKIIFSLQNFAYLKISPGSLNRIFKNLEFWVFHDIFGHFCLFWPYFSQYTLLF